MKLNHTPPPSHPAIQEIIPLKATEHVVIKPYTLQNLVYTSTTESIPKQVTTNLTLPVGTQLTIQENKDFPGKVWLVGTIEIETPNGKITERLARLIPESDLEYFAPNTDIFTDRIVEETAESVNRSVDNRL